MAWGGAPTAATAARIASRRFDWRLWRTIAKLAAAGRQGEAQRTGQRVGVDLAEVARQVVGAGGGRDPGWVEMSVEPLGQSGDLALEVREVQVHGHPARPRPGPRPRWVTACCVRGRTAAPRTRRGSRYGSRRPAPHTWGRSASSPAGRASASLLEPATSATGTARLMRLLGGAMLGAVCGLLTGSMRRGFQ